MFKKGYIAAEVVPGSFDSLDFFDFIAEQVVSPFDCHAKVRSFLLYIAATDESISQQSKCPCD